MTNGDPASPNGAGSNFFSTMNDHYDVIIIGTGAGGGTLLNKLAPSGKRILILERGPFLPREKENWDTKVAFNTTRATPIELHPGSTW